jgi:hypothetical protein
MVLLMAATTPAVIHAQTTFANFLNPLNASSPGVHFYGVSVFSSYYTGGGAPYGLPVTIAAPLGGSPTYDVVTGATASFGWNKSGEKWHASASYTPSYVRSVYRSDNNVFGHSFSADIGRRLKLTRKWSMGLSATATLSEFPQFFFTPGSLDFAASLPSTFDAFSAAVLNGVYTNPQLASLLTSTPAPASPEQTFLYGNRVLNTSAGAGFTYTISQRSSLQIGISATRWQSLRHFVPVNGDASRLYIPRSIDGSVNLSWSYSLTPRTSLTASVVSGRTFSRVQDGYSTSAQFSIGRIMSRHWFAQGGVGAGMLLFNRHSFLLPRTVQYIGNGAIGFKTYAHTLFVSYNRSLGDAYGAGSGATSSLNATWGWRRPASNWSFFSTAGWQRLENRSLNNATSWLAAAGLARSLGAQMRMSAQYSYFRFPFAIVTSSGLQEGVSVALSWSPSGH